jgi:hypothetical protein
MMTHVYRVRWRSGLALLLAAVAGTSRLPAAPLEIDAAAQVRLGVKTAPIAAAGTVAWVDAVATVLDPTPLVRMNSDLTAALAASSASQAEAERTQKLVQQDSAVSQRALEAARAQALSDAGRVAALRSELRAGWGAQLGTQTPAQRDAIVSALARGESVLVRIESLGAATTRQPSQAWLQLASGEERRAQVLGAFLQPGSGIVPGWLARTSGTGLAPGMALTARFDAAAATAAPGQLIPRTALLRWNGLQYAYVAVDAEHFERRAVTDAQAVPGGWRVEHGFRAGERVVVQGAAALLGAETLAHAQDEPEAANAGPEAAGTRKDKD